MAGGLSRTANARAPAQRAGTSQQTLADDEHGRKRPGVGTLERLLRVCRFELELAPHAIGPRRRLLEERRSEIVEAARVGAGEHRPRVRLGDDERGAGRRDCGLAQTARAPSQKR